ncbi:MAG: MotA/TolQ/ExbB proton channel family protein [Gemmatimonadetes bacterium]|nr:MotA/TolQ/ExbB proton channel family protein [Gemmatimonadota bacterium]
MGPDGGTGALSLLPQGVVAAASTSPESLLALVAGSDGVTKGVLAVLGALSLLSWGIMFAKWRVFARAEARAGAFLRDFTKAASVEEAMQVAARAAPSGFTVVFARAMQFIADTRPALAGTADRSARLSAAQVEALRLVLDAESGRERERLSQYVPWLATVGSVSPLIGLLGTVLGVIQAFTGIAAKGSGNIGAVAPGIAIALVATAAALAVAIPAAFAYNLFAARLNRLDVALDGFGSELIALMARDGRI